MRTETYELSLNELESWKALTEAQKELYIKDTKKGIAVMKRIGEWSSVIESEKAYLKALERLI
jgi:hypothetical protein